MIRRLKGTATCSSAAFRCNGDRIEVHVISPGFFDTMGIRALTGRKLLPSDSLIAPRVVVVNEAFARAYFTDVGAIGQRFWPAAVAKAQAIRIVGVPVALAIAKVASAALNDLLYGVQPTDPVSFVLAVAALLGGAIGSAYVPAAGAARTDPMISLRCE